MGVCFLPTQRIRYQMFQAEQKAKVYMQQLLESDNERKTLFKEVKVRKGCFPCR